ncbi:hypothetical protein PHMEG_00018796 [Phytophthora megakarya]|uniref:Uncharacterized protein n=1 Tax=Phytophthora megakarya TaxID=4795 RepID=A0A225VT54_9STRA|nr:hypothetical protein PHMEG_00018796 [Phytophthora megakarya]
MSKETCDGTEHVANTRRLVELSDSEEDELNAGRPKHCYLKLLKEHYALYSGQLGRFRLDGYILLLSVDYVRHTQSRILYHAAKKT